MTESTEVTLAHALVASSDGPRLLNAETGELVLLADAPADLIASVLRTIEVRLHELYDAKRVLGAEMIQRMDKRATWTVRARGVEVTAPSARAGRVGWDETILVPILDALVAEGVIDREAQLAAVEPRTEYHVLARGVNALLKIEGLEERLAPARVTAATKPRSVKVNVRRGGE